MSNIYTFYTVDVFTDRTFGGNPLAVLPAASGLNSQQMQKIAREFNLSETAFILPSQRKDASYRLRIFTPQVELAFAGHPTIGTAYVLAISGLIPTNQDTTTIFLEENVGIIPVRINFNSGMPVYTELAAVQMPEYRNQAIELEKLSTMLSLDCQDILSVEAVSCGLPFLFVELTSRESLKRANLKIELWQDLLSDCWASSLYLFYYNRLTTGAPIYARMFAPGLGIREDPATGSAATALAGFLSRDFLQSETTLHWQIYQGEEMERPSLIKIEADIRDGNVAAIRVGGSCVLVMQGIIKLD